MTTFDELAARRDAYVEAARNNGFEDGLRRLLADLYPDNAHFIYELLQNAEDAGARDVTFELRQDGLRVEHNGSKLFDLRDIDSITGIGQSTKADDATSIGKFGVGFKAVFAYTQSPEIQSGEHSFVIRDLFVPVAVTPATRPGLTTFWFPFDRPDKPADIAVHEVAKALRDISRSTLLFLKNISLVACFFPDGDERILARRAITDRVIAIESVHEGTGPSYWYRVAGDVLVDEKLYPVAAAFALDTTHEEDHEELSRPTPGSATSASPGFSVRAIDGQVFIYFPAYKETSGLKFHIHAPFASTVARDSVRDEAGNDVLVGGIADLIASAMPGMRNEGLINDGLLGALANNEDELPKRYHVIRERVLEAFHNERITPKAGGGYAESKQLIRSVAPLRASIQPEDVGLLRSITVEDRLRDERGIGWLQERTNRPGAFLDSLDVIEFGRSELAEVFNRIANIVEEIESGGDDASEFIDEVDLTDLDRWNNWIASKDDRWLRSFYAAIGRLSQQDHNPYSPGDYRFYRYSDPLPDSVAGVPIIRVRDGSSSRHVEGEKAFLPTSPGLELDGLVVDMLVPFESDSNSESKAKGSDRKALIEFFEIAGVKKWDATARLDARFSSYEGITPAVGNEHMEDLSTLSLLLNDRAVAPSAYRSRPILLAVGHEGALRWAPPSEVYIDQPFEQTGLTALYESPSYRGSRPARLSSEYISTEVDVCALAKQLGAISEFRIARTPIWSNRHFDRSWRWSGRENHNMRSDDWSIPNFQAIVDSSDETLLRRLWQVVSNANETVGDAIYRANASSKVYRIDSQLLQQLRVVPWILDRDGNLRIPEDATQADLADGLTLPSNAPLLQRAGFGRSAALREQKQRGDEARARDLGFESAEEAREAAKAIREDRQGFQDWLRERKRGSLPEGSSSSPDRRQSRVADSASGAPVRRYEERSRSVRVQDAGFREGSKTYLREMYTNADGEMICQVCRKTMPFKIGGEYYFEAVQFQRSTQRDLRENALALCPTCSAKYRHALGTDVNDLRDDLLTQEVGKNGSLTVEVVLADEEESIRFVGTHALDLQAALEVTEGVGPSES